MSQWQYELKNTIKSYPELCKLLRLDIKDIYSKSTIDSTNNQFPLLVTKSFISRIKPNDLKDPLLLQILPNTQIDINLTNYSTDPLQELKSNKLPGMIHKYNGRILMLATKNCAIHCQYCFRQHFDYKNNIAVGENLASIINYIANDSSIEEIILSGGDPLLTSNNYFINLFKKLSIIPHVTTIRIHSRIPIVLPSRLGSDLIKILTDNRFQIVMVLHTNHPNEINQEVSEYINKLHNTKIVLLNQTVLLKNINNTSTILAELSKKLFSLKILPYYLHILDQVKGAEHFAVSIAQAVKILQELTKILPGYLVPRLVTEKPGAKSKILINYNCIN